MRLDFPRQSVTGVRAAHDTLYTLLDRQGLRPESQSFATVPGRMDAAAILFAAALIPILTLRRGVFAACAACALVVAGALAAAGALDAALPHVTLSNLCVVVEPLQSATREIWLGAHYDSKTELFDHRGRALATGVALGLGGLALALAAARRPRAVRLAATLAVAGLVAVGAGAHLTHTRSHGAVDDAASVA